MSAATLSAPNPVVPLMTADEFLAKYIDERFVELISGRVVRLPMPGCEHGEICINAGAIIREFVKK